MVKPEPKEEPKKVEAKKPEPKPEPKKSDRFDSVLDSILKKLGKEPREAMRRQEPPYKELALDNPALTRQQLVKAMVENPVLIERPIVLANGKARIGRPPESVLEII